MIKKEREAITKQFFSLENKTVVVTGGGGILAGEIAVAAARFGGRIAVLDLFADAAKKTGRRITEGGGDAISLQCNVTSEEDLEACCQEILEHYGTIDGLVNGAGGNKAAATTSAKLSFFDIPAGMHREVLDLNFLGTMLPCRVFGKVMAGQGEGSILNIASIAGFRPLTKAAAYAAGKAAVINFTRWLAVYFCREYSPRIRVNALAPGFFATSQNRYLLFDEAGGLTQRGEDILGQVPQKRFGDPGELTAASVWLLSGSASFVTGSVITIDGGFDAFSGV
ncbi:MAG: SDR family oxidoreductase [Bacteroidales bacterium]